jgi:hypothetical protein
MAAHLRGDLTLEGDPSSWSDPADLPDPRAHGDAAPAEEGSGVSDDLIKILDGNTFVVSDGRGTSRRRHRPDGPVLFDTRFPQGG